MMVITIDIRLVHGRDGTGGAVKLPSLGLEVKEPVTREGLEDAVRRACNLPVDEVVARLLDGAEKDGVIS